MTEHLRHPPDARGREVTMATCPEAHVLDLWPLEVLTGANCVLPDGPAPCDVQVFARAPGPVTTRSGASLNADIGVDRALRDRDPIDTLVISGGHGASRALEDTDLMTDVRAAAARARRAVSICTGALIPAEAGLLDRRRATTHRWWCPILETRPPRSRSTAMRCSCPTATSGPRRE